MTGRQLDHARIESRIGRRLTAAEQHVDVEAIDQLLNDAKDDLDEAIQVEQQRAARTVARGGNARLEVTPRMLDILRVLRDAGARHGRDELRSMGYRLRSARRAFATDDELEATLRARLGSLTMKIEHHALGADLSVMAQSAIEKAVVQVLGARSIASDLVSPAFISGLGATFEEHADLIERWQYSAVNDAGLCDQCAPHDGEVFDTLDDLFDVLPNFGPNPECLGGDRCRCRALPLPPEEGAQAPAPDVVTPSEPIKVTTANNLAAAGARDALYELGRVHDFPADAPPIRIRTAATLSSPNAAAEYRYSPDGPVDIRISTTTPDPGFSALHEVGHYVDHQLIGEPNAFASAATNVMLDDWQAAIEASGSVQTLRRWLADPPTFERVMPNGETISFTMPRPLLEYLLSPEELFARSYSQWAAIRSSDPTLVAELAHTFHLPYPEQWPDHDFAAIAEAFDRLVRRLGWQKR